MGVKNGLIGLEDRISGECTITLVLNPNGNTELFAENIRSVLHCDENFLTLRAYGSEIRISGAPLIFDTFGAQGIRISGKIRSLSLEDCAPAGNEV